MTKPTGRPKKVLDETAIRALCEAGMSVTKICKAIDGPANRIKEVIRAWRESKVEHTTNTVAAAPPIVANANFDQTAARVMFNNGSTVDEIVTALHAPVEAVRVLVREWKKDWAKPVADPDAQPKPVAVPEVAVTPGPPPADDLQERISNVLANGPTITERSPGTTESMPEPPRKPLVEHANFGADDGAPPPDTEPVMDATDAVERGAVLPPVPVKGRHNRAARISGDSFEWDKTWSLRQYFLKCQPTLKFAIDDDDQDMKKLCRLTLDNPIAMEMKELFDAGEKLVHIRKAFRRKKQESAEICRVVLNEKWPMVFERECADLDDEQWAAEQSVRDELQGMRDREVAIEAIVSRLNEVLDARKREPCLSPA